MFKDLVKELTKKGAKRAALIRTDGFRSCWFAW